MRAGANRGQKCWISLGVEFQATGTLGPLKEQYTLLTAEPTVQTS